MYVHTGKASNNPLPSQTPKKIPNSPSDSYNSPSREFFHNSLPSHAHLLPHLIITPQLQATTGVLVLFCPFLTVEAAKEPKKGTQFLPPSPLSHHMMRGCKNWVLAAVLISLLLQTFPCSSSALAVGLARHRHDVRPGLAGGCDIFSGSWVPDESSAPTTYTGFNCPVIDAEFNCQLYGRPDSDYLRYRWKPTGCELPRFDGVDFLRRMQGKTVMFVGDSLGRNQWESLICMLRAAAPQSPAQMITADPLYTYKFLEYDVVVSFYRAPYLVDIDVIQGKRVLMLDDISENGDAWRDADVLSFNSGHWWTHTGSLQGWEYMELEGRYYEDMDRLVAFQRGLTTWANWVDLNVDAAATRVFFQSISPSHYDSREWPNPVSKNCYGETAPMSGLNSTGPYAAQAQVLQAVIQSMRSPAHLLDITALSELRKDAHPSVYSGDFTPAQRAAGSSGATDCSHWCLPGLPDTWNQLFYTSLFYL